MSAISKSKQAKVDAILIRRILSYDPQTGLFTWLEHKCLRKGMLAGCANKRGSIQIYIKNTLYLAHRLAWLHFYGEWPDRQVDHKDMNPQNNAISNLRLALNGQNKANSRAQRNNKLGIKGVTRVGHFRYRAAIQGRKIGEYDTVVKAHAAYMREAKKVYGEFARGS